jgi:hypothetical protein
MTPTLEVRVRELLSQIEADGLYKRERTISSAQAGRIRVVSQASERELIDLCANNYLGLADHPEVIAAAKRGLDEFGFGMASVRFRMLTVKGIYGREMFETWHKMLAMLESGLDIRKIITRRLPVTEFKAGFEIMRTGNCGKIVLDWKA